MFLHFIENREHKEAFLELARRVADSDGFVNRNETNYLRSWQTELGMDGWEPDAGLRSRPIAELIGSIGNPQTRNLFVAEILLLIYADGRFDEEERRIADEVKLLFGLSETRYAALTDWVRRMDQLKIEGVHLILNHDQTSDDVH